MRRTIAIVPAKGSSSRLPRKNLADLGGHPLLWCTVGYALQSGLERVLVDTDDPEVADLARSWGAEVPQLRMASLAAPDVPATDAVVSRLRSLLEAGEECDTALMLLPTAPFRPDRAIDEALTLLQQNPGTAVVSVSPTGKGLPHLKRVEGGRIVDVAPHPRPSFQSDEVTPLFTLNGSVYAAAATDLLRAGSFHSLERVALVMDPPANVDIDGPRDLAMARTVMNGLLAVPPPDYRWLASLRMISPGVERGA